MHLKLSGYIYVRSYSIESDQYVSLTILRVFYVHFSVW